MSEIKYDFFMSQIEHIRDIKENEKTKLSIVFYEVSQSSCILRICKGRNLSAVCSEMKKVRNKNIVVMYDYVYANGDTYIIEEYIDGKTLEEIIEEKGTFSEQETVRIVSEVCDGLYELHGKKPPIVHNDINTSNIMIREDGSIKLFDFDISRTYKKGENKNTSLFGTEEYASPEHFGYGQSEPRTDIYSLGVTMHKMLTGYSLSNEHKVTYKGKLKKVIKKCVEVDPKKRYANVRQLKKDLEKHNKKKKRLLHKLLTLVFLALILIILWFINDDTKDDQTNKNKLIETTLTVETTTETQEISGENESTSLNEEDATKKKEVADTVEKKMQNAYMVEGQMKTMIALNDGTFVWLENISGNYYIKTSAGNEKKINEVSGNYDCELVYDGYKDILYLFEENYDIINVYTVDESLSVNNVAELISNSLSMKDFQSTFCHFFSDGMAYCFVLDSELIDTSTWSDIGELDYEIYAVIDDRLFALDWNNYEGSVSLNEVDFQGSVIKENKMPENFDIDTGKLGQIYATKDFLYFVTTENEKEYVYRFDGDNFEIVACLNDYKYYTPMEYDDLCVTSDAIWMYDDEYDVLKKFEIK